MTNADTLHAAVQRQLALRRAWLGQPPTLLKDDKGKPAAIRLRCPCGEHWLDLPLKHWKLTRHANETFTVSPGIVPPCACPPVRYEGGMWTMERAKLVIHDNRKQPEGFFADPLDYPPDMGEPVPYMTRWDYALLEREVLGVFLSSQPFIEHPAFDSAKYMQIRQLPGWSGDDIPRRGLLGVIEPLQGQKDVVFKLSKSKKPYARFNLTDGEISVPCVAFNRCIEQGRQWLRPDCMVVVQGKVQGVEAEEDQEGLALELVVDSVDRARSW